MDPIERWVTQYFFEKMFDTWFSHSYFYVTFQIDSYSAFYDNGGISETQLNDKLRRLNIKKLFITGLGLDYSVLYTAIDAKELGFDVIVVQDATRAIIDEGVEDAIKRMKDRSISIVAVSDILPTKLVHPIITRPSGPSGSGEFLIPNSLIILIVSILPLILKYIHPEC